VSLPTNRRRVLVLEILTAGPARDWYSRFVSDPNYFGVIASVVSLWCQEMGAQVVYRTYTGRENPEDLLAGEWDVAFIAAYTRGAWTAYACSHLLRSRGTVTALGGPHAHAYPEDSAEHFDFVLGFTDQEVLREVLEGAPAKPHQPGRWIDCGGHSAELPSLRRRAGFIDTASRKAWLLRAVPLLASYGCPFSCAFCSDAEIPFRQVAPARIEDDVRFAIERWPGALMVWHDPNFGVRFDDLLGAIERATRHRTGRFLAETTLSLLTPERVERLGKAGFVGLLPGIENWEGFGAKMGLGRATPDERMEHLSAKLRAFTNVIPFLQVNFVFGVEPEAEARQTPLTLEFLRRVPAAWPNLNLFQAWGRLSPLARSLARDGRLLDVPFPLLDQKICVNVAGDFRASIRAYIAVTEAAISRGAVQARLLANRGWQARVVNLLRGLGREQRQRIRWQRRVLSWLESDRGVRDFFDGRSAVVPPQLRALALQRVGPFASLLPAGVADYARSGRRRRPLREHGPLQPEGVEDASC
jgi:hypothetical protein